MACRFVVIVVRDAKKTNDFDPEMRDWSLIRNREELGRRKRRKKKKQTKGRLMLQDQEREENGGEANLYTQGQHEVHGRRWGW